MGEKRRVGRLGVLAQASAIAAAAGGLPPAAASALVPEQPEAPTEEAVGAQPVIFDVPEDISAEYARTSAEIRIHEEAIRALRAEQTAYARALAAVAGVRWENVLRWDTLDAEHRQMIVIQKPAE